MEKLNKSKHFCIIAGLAVLACNFIKPAFAEETLSPATDGKTIVSEENLALPMDAQDIKIINKLKKEDIKKFNAKLHEAMALYFDKSYRLAFPVLREVAQKAPTMDVTYWLGMTALRTGQSDIAILKFKEMLNRYPDLHSVRLRLISSYLQKGDIVSAKAELETIKRTASSESMREQVAEALEQIEKADKKYMLRITGTIGLKYDDNLSATPGDGQVPFGVGQITTKQEADFVQVYNGAIDLIGDMGDRGGWLWTNRVSYYLNKYPGTRERFDYSQFGLNTGLRYSDNLVSFNLPFGVKVKRYDRLSDLSTTKYIDPDLSIAVNKKLDLGIGFKLSHEDYEPSKNTQDSYALSVSAGPTFRFDAMNREHQVSVKVDGSVNNARISSLSYEEAGISPSYTTTLSEDKTVRFFVQTGVHNRNYNKAFGFDSTREDKRYDAFVLLSKSFSKKYKGSVYWTGIENDSNHELYEYNKSVIGVNFTVQLDY